ncbi:SprT-like domain-containing protein [Robertmurraya siralis]|uniref:SprT-like domain-containing protein n=1 Tax=Robertmurraya siralis TaxID=77777 RepID=UPI0010F5AF08|nr:SprT-like domain-containing protein [Robertmurraya siralis]
MPIVTVEWLENKARKLVKKHWGIKNIPKIVIDITSEDKWNKDADEPETESWTTFGLYHSKTQTIEFNSKVNETRSLKQIEDTLLHELCHWYLHTNGKNYRDRDRRFALELIRVGAKPSGTKVAKQAYKEAKLYKKYETFEIIERAGDIISHRIHHSRKNEDDFRQDLKKTLIEVYNDNQRDEDGDILIGDVLEIMSEKYGYKIIPIAVYGLELMGGRYGYSNLSERDVIEDALTCLGMKNEEVENVLKKETEEIME